MFRFFTVYGPWGRPDMALFRFVGAILKDQPIDVYNHGNHKRDFTYVDDLVRAIALLIDAPPERLDDATAAPGNEAAAPFRIVNIGNSEQIALLDFISAIEAELGKEAKRNYLPMQKGDVHATWASTELLRQVTGYRPQTNYREGIKRFVAWYRDYYEV
jgi:UDP-glucuronate 4-epimerase